MHVTGSKKYDRPRSGALRRLRPPEDDTCRPRGGPDLSVERGRPSGPAAARGLRGGVAVAAGACASALIQFIGLTVLSRLLSPADFGLIAMVLVFVNLGNLVRDFGLPTAALQARTLSAQEKSNFFWLNVGVAALVAVVLALATPLIVIIYSEPQLYAVIPVMAAVVFIGGVGAQIQVNLARGMRYWLLVVSDLAAQAVGLVAAILAAQAGMGYWALVVQSVVAAILLLAIRWIGSGWLPGRFRRGHGVRGMVATGAHYGLAQILSFAQSNVDTVVLGVLYPATQVGYYSRAYQLLSAPAVRLVDPLTQVVIPTLNARRLSGGDPDALLSRVQFAVGGITIMAFSVAGGAAPALVPLLFGKQWNESVLVFQILAVGGSVWILNHISYWAFLSHQKSRELLRYNLVSKPLGVLFIVVGAQFGIVGAAFGYALSMAASWPLNLVWLRRSANFPSRSFAFGGLRLLLAGTLGGLAASLVIQMGGRADGFMVALVSVLSGAIVFLVCLLAMPVTRRQLGAVPAALRLLLDSSKE